MKEIDFCLEEIIEILCKIQKEEVKNVLEKAHEIRLKQNELSCDEESEEENQGSDCGSSDDNSFFETDSDIFSDLED